VLEHDSVTKCNPSPRLAQSAEAGAFTLASRWEHLSRLYHAESFRSRDYKSGPYSSARTPFERMFRAPTKSAAAWWPQGTQENSLCVFRLALSTTAHSGHDRLVSRGSIAATGITVVGASA
jgi:hypothetical protein